MRKLFVMFASLMLLAGVATASPLTDYSAGKVSVDLDWRNTELQGDYDGTYAIDFKKKYSLDAGLTIGLGNNFAVQYNVFNPTPKTTALPDFLGDSFTGRLSSRQYNLIYRFNPEFAVYTGVMHANGSFKDLDWPAIYANTHTRDIWQFGLVASTKLGSKATGYGMIGVGRDLTNWVAGISFAVAPDTELNLSYRDLKINHFVTTSAGARLDSEASGFGAGITYKF